MISTTVLLAAIMALTGPTSCSSFTSRSISKLPSLLVSFSKRHDHVMFQSTNFDSQDRLQEKDGHQSAASSAFSSKTINRRQAAISSLMTVFPILLFGSADVATSTNNKPLLSLSPPAAWASGGATAGKYTTIPIAKRRYYGRVEQGVHDFLGLAQHVIDGSAVTKGTVESPDAIYKFFDTTRVVVVAARNQAVNGQCTKADPSCRGKEIRDSRYHDMKTSMYLLANAFRINQQKAPDNLPTVKAAKKFFKEVDAMEVAVQKLLATNNPSSNNNNLQQRDTIMAAQQHYVKALDYLDVYLDLVELPPTDSGYYDTEFDTRVGETARIM